MGNNPMAGMDPAMLQGMLQNPMVQQMMQNLSQNPQMLQQMMQSNPMVQQMLQSNPMMLGFHLDQPRWVGTLASIPGSCSVKFLNGEQHMHWNELDVGVARGDLAPVCRAQYVQLAFGEANCPDGTRIETLHECET